MKANCLSERDIVVPGRVLPDPASDAGFELGEDVAICDPVRMEVLAGSRDEQHLHRLPRLLARATVLPTAPANYDQAAGIYRHCRRQGETVRRLIDCLIASVAISADVAILHRDDDFDVMARHTELRVDLV